MKQGDRVRFTARSMARAGLSGLPVPMDIGTVIKVIDDGWIITEWSPSGHLAAFNARLVEKVEVN